MGGQAEEIRRFLKEHYREGSPIAEAVRLGIRALTVTQNKTLTERDLEVAVLDRKRERRKFRRLSNGELRAILGRPDPPEGGRPMGTS
jgi:proteasome alpha subunit